MNYRVGLLIASPDSSGEQLLNGIVDFVRHNPHWIVQHSDWWKPKRRSDYDGFDGLIVRQPIIGLPKLARKLSVPIVDISSHRRPMSGIPRVTVDNYAVGKIGAEHFLRRGYRNLAFLGRKAPMYSRDRLRGFQETAEAGGAQVFVYAQPGLYGWSRESVLKPVHRWLRQLPRPLAVMGDSDSAARIILEACQPDIGVPEEVAVVGVDNNIWVCELCKPPLSSISLELRRVGYRAASLLEDLMRGKKSPSQPIVVPPGDLCLRRSADVFAVQDRAVAKAIRFIEDHATDKVSIQSVCRHVFLSKRSLELRFRKATGRSPREEIRHVRMRLARNLLGTPMSIAAVAAKAGFSDQSRFGRIFKRHTGMSPLAYRRSLHEGH